MFYVCPFRSFSYKIVFREIQMMSFKCLQFRVGIVGLFFVIGKPNAKGPHAPLDTPFILSLSVCVD